jgi:hypothetical protein
MNPKKKSLLLLYPLTILTLSTPVFADTERFRDPSFPDIPSSDEQEGSRVVVDIVKNNQDIIVKAGMSGLAARFGGVGPAIAIGAAGAIYDRVTASSSKPEPKQCHGKNCVE